MKMRGLSVAAALRRGGCQGHTPRRSEIGFHTPPKTAIFICGGELEKVMAHFHENAGLGGGSRSVATLMALRERYT
jgi:hypothetical protein